MPHSYFVFVLRRGLELLGLKQSSCLRFPNAGTIGAHYHVPGKFSMLPNRNLVGMGGGEGGAGEPTQLHTSFCSVGFISPLMNEACLFQAECHLCFRQYARHDDHDKISCFWGSHIQSLKPT